MTVADLIDKLLTLPPDMMVVIPGYEGGYDNPEVCMGAIVQDTNWDGKNKEHWYMGRHDKDYDWRPQDGEPNVVVIGRGK